ncbi:trypsin-like peptidase domain-containing protein [Nocardioides sp. HM23]|uniref:S1C family serine protease n=1 Tax=Nocardioides bizhenqiangii TaxID=3095076 RepID=UPI002AC9FA94|nr:trypsin-like peptidase domain-containing protein [Nocardioides sp. HM23]MDZ5621390.1 trypsin-like peptidase domain-containing protein [Nocardioides sp. HM23]
MTISAPPSYPPLSPPPSAPPPPQRAPRPRRGGFAAAVLAGALVVGGGAGLGGAAMWSALDDDGAAGDGGGTTSAPLQVADTGDGFADPAAEGSVEEVANKVLPSVVALDVTAGGTGGSGSGVVLTEDGLILTNDHVVTLAGAADPETAEVTVSFADGSTTTGEVVGTDPLTDTALVQAHDVSGLTPVTLGKSADLDVGEQVVAIGSPYGLDSTVTSGIVSALDRPVEVARDENGNTTAYPAIQTDAAINHGNSGGALVNMDGQLVGINASIRTPDGSDPNSGSIGLGFAIPIDEVVPIVEQLRNGETPTHARLGIEIGDGEAGAVVRSIEDGSAAARAGIREGDVITRVDDHAIDRAGSLVATIRSYRPDDQVTITYLRGGDQETTELQLGSDAA